MRLRQIIFTLAISALVGIAQAQLPAYYPHPKDFPWAGTVDELNLGKRLIVIGDRAFKIPTGMRVYTLESKFASLLDLKLGQTVGCRFLKEGWTSTATDVYILPDGYRVPGFD